MSIDYATIAKAGGIGKGRSRKQIKARKDREDAKQLKAFRDQVWRREEIGCDWGGDHQCAHCQNCGARVHRGKGYELTGEVHHRIFRGNKATRYDPDNGVLLCNHLVNNCHQLVQEGRITLGEGSLPPQKKDA